jgi:hypothetical protein
MIDADTVPSMILFGPPGTGKTTLAHIIARETDAQFEQLNAVSAGVADIRKIIDAAQKRLRMLRQRTILFIDEIHRFFSKSHRCLLPFVENGTSSSSRNDGESLFRSKLAAAFAGQGFPSAAARPRRSCRHPGGCVGRQRARPGQNGHHMRPGSAGGHRRSNLG